MLVYIVTHSWYDDFTIVSLHASEAGAAAAAAGFVKTRAIQGGERYMLEKQGIDWHSAVESIEVDEREVMP